MSESGKRLSAFHLFLLTLFPIRFERARPQSLRKNPYRHEFAEALYQGTASAVPIKHPKRVGALAPAGAFS
jgi:hypothetical protein